MYKANNLSILAALAVGLLVLGRPCAAIPVVGGQYVDVPTSSNPFAGATLIDSFTTPDLQLLSDDFSFGTFPPPKYLSAIAHLTTQVYRTPGGTLGFAYTIQAKNFSRPFQGPPFDRYVFPRFTVPGFENFTADVSGNPPDGATATRPLDGKSIRFDFDSGDPALIGITTFYSFTGNATFYIDTDATNYQSADVLLNLANIDGRVSMGGVGNPTPLSSFIPADASSAPVPEPLAISLLPLAIAALAIKHRRPT